MATLFTRFIHTAARMVGRAADTNTPNLDLQNTDHEAHPRSFMTPSYQDPSEYQAGADEGDEVMKRTEAEDKEKKKKKPKKNGENGNGANGNGANGNGNGADDKKETPKNGANGADDKKEKPQNGANGNGEGAAGKEDESEAKKVVPIITPTSMTDGRQKVPLAQAKALASIKEEATAHKKEFKKINAKFTTAFAAWEETWHKGKMAVSSKYVYITLPRGYLTDISLVLLIVRRVKSLRPW
jgi:hypothetical protein